MPADLGVGITELDGADEVRVIRAEGVPGYLPSYVQECTIETVLTVGDTAEAHGTGTFVNPFPGDGADEWAGGNSPTIDYHFTAEVSQFSRDAIKRGINAWEGQTTACFNLVWMSFAPGQLKFFPGVREGPPSTTRRPESAAPQAP